MSEPESSLVITEGRPASEEFLRIVGERLGTRLESLVLKTSWTVRAPKLIRQCFYFLTAVRIARKRTRYRFLIFFQQTIAFHYALRTRLSRKSAPVAVTPLILRPRRGLWRAARERAARLFVRSRAIDAFMVFSRAEREAYARQFGRRFAAKLVFVPLGGNAPLSPEARAEGRSDPPAGSGRRGYHFSGGSSNRDYGTLFRAFSGLGEKLVVSCAPGDLRGLTVPEEVEIARGSIGEVFLDLLQEADSVLIPLNEADYSSGQIVLIQAMRCGKPIIITKTGGVADYVDERSALFVRPGSAEDIAAAVRRLASEPGLAASLGRAARDAYERDLTPARFSERVADIVRDAEARRTGPPVENGA